MTTIITTTTSTDKEEEEEDLNGDLKIPSNNLNDKTTSIIIESSLENGVKSQEENESDKEQEDTIEEDEEESKNYSLNKKPVIIDEDLSSDQTNLKNEVEIIATNLEELLTDMNYSVILAFFDKFRQQFVDYTYKSLESNLLNTKACKLFVFYNFILLI
jgi:hypothetical protein